MQTGQNVEDYYFFPASNLEKEYGGVWFWIVEISFYNEHRCIYDGHITRRIKSFLPRGFAEEMESAFSFNGSQQEGRRLLMEAGFKWGDKNL